jgi:hypothetical protein
LQIDVVLNLSDAGEATEVPPPQFPRMRQPISRDPRILAPPPPPKPEQRQKEYIGELLSVARVLADIHPANGCVRISSVDLLDMQVVLNRMPSENVEWEKIRNLRTTSKLAEVSVAALQNRKEQPNFLRTFLKGLESPIDKCGSGTAAPMHAVIFVSHGYEFPGGSHKESFKFPDAPDFHAYYYMLYAASRPNYDDLSSYLKSAGAKSHEVYQPRDLRDAMARTLNDIARPAK